MWKQLGVFIIRCVCPLVMNDARRTCIRHDVCLSLYRVVVIITIFPKTLVPALPTSYIWFITEQFSFSFEIDRVDDTEQSTLGAEFFLNFRKQMFLQIKMHWRKGKKRNKETREKFPIISKKSEKARKKFPRFLCPNYAWRLGDYHPEWISSFNLQMLYYRFFSLWRNT